MTKSRMPEFIQRRIDLKNESVLAVARTFGDDTEVTIISTIGFVKGKIQTNFIQDDSMSELTKRNDELFINRNEYLSGLVGCVEDENPLIINNYSVITLTDVELIPLSPCSGTSYKLDILNLYSDQIVGFSHGKLSLGESSTECSG